MKLNKLLLLLTLSMITACSPMRDKESSNEPYSNNTLNYNENQPQNTSKTDAGISEKTSDNDTVVQNQNESQDIITTSLFEGYTLIEVEGGDTNGYRKPNVVVDVGYGDRVYWAFTNGYGQLIRIVADEIIPQDPSKEPVNQNGRYFDEEAYVPGVEADDLDQGHVVADSLGGVSNAYNITPQNSTLNRYGDQAYMEKIMRSAGGSRNFEAIITYPNESTQIPSHYKFSYTINGEQIVLSFDNVNPEATLVKDSSFNTLNNNSIMDSESEKVRAMDTNGNNQISIKEAKNAGFMMPITSDHWLYKYMTDGDGDGLVGE